jgi:hypothetical protein
VIADPTVLERVLRETGVERTPVAPGMAGYFEAVTERIVDWIERSGGMAWARSLMERVVPMVPTIARVALVVAAGVLVWIVYASLRRRERAAPRALPAVRDVNARPRHPDREAWRRELETRLSRGDLAGALLALWWWFATGVSAGAVDPAWTNHDLVARAGRQDLAPLADALDTLLYSPRRPAIEDVRRFAARVDAVLS